MATLPCRGSACCCACCSCCCCWTLRGWRHYLAGALLVVLVVGPVKIDRELQVPGGNCCACSLLWHIAENNSTFRYFEGALLVVVLDHLEFDAEILNEESLSGVFVVVLLLLLVVCCESTSQCSLFSNKRGRHSARVVVVLGTLWWATSPSGGGCAKLLGLVVNLTFAFRTLSFFLLLNLPASFPATSPPLNFPASFPATSPTLNLPASFPATSPTLNLPASFPATSPTLTRSKLWKTLHTAPLFLNLGVFVGRS